MYVHFVDIVYRYSLRGWMGRAILVHIPAPAGKERYRVGLGATRLTTRYCLTPFESLVRGVLNTNWWE